MFTQNISNIGDPIMGKMNWEASKVCVKPRRFAAFAYRISGNGKIKTDSANLNVPPHSVLYMPAGTGYSADYTKTEIICFHVSGELPRGAAVFEFEGDFAIRSLFENAYAAYSEKRVGYELLTLGLFYQLLAVLDGYSGRSGKVSGAFETAVHCIDHSYADPELKISEICTDAGICETAFRRQFQKIYSKSPIEYITERRCEKAKQLLMHRSVSVERAAAESGFSDSKYFSRVIKKYFGCTPSQLRELYTK